LTRQRITIVAALASLAGAGSAGPSYAAGAGSAVQPVGKHCSNQSTSRVAGAKATPYATCLTAMRRLARGESRSPQIACGRLSRKRASGAAVSPFAKCVTAGTQLVKYGNGVDRSYLEQMIPHHVGAVDMAKIVPGQTQTPFLLELADTIVRTQNEEIARMRGMAARLKAAGIPAVPLGLSKAQTGMDHDMSHLVGANPFDVVFVDMMIPHHQGAVTMSDVVFAKGASLAVKQLAEQISNSQLGEIRNMRAFREALTGSPDPGAGTPLHTHPGDTEPHPH
jgi:uncharacterized protein (DUF305 family)